MGLKLHSSTSASSGFDDLINLARGELVRALPLRFHSDQLEHFRLRDGKSDRSGPIELPGLDTVALAGLPHGELSSSIIRL